MQAKRGSRFKVPAADSDFRSNLNSAVQVLVSECQCPSRSEPNLQHEGIRPGVVAVVIDGLGRRWLLGP